MQVEYVRAWLLQRLAYVYAPGGRHGVGARAICSGANSPYMMVTCALREELRDAEGGRVLQAAVRRCLQVRLACALVSGLALRACPPGHLRRAFGPSPVACRLAPRMELLES